MTTFGELRKDKIIEALKADYPSFFSNDDEEQSFVRFILEHFEKPDIIWENSAKLMIFKADRRLDNPIIHIKEGDDSAFIRKLI